MAVPLENPIDNFLDYIFNLDVFGPNTVYFLGKFYKTSLVPFSYLPIWILISTPILNTALFIFGFILQLNFLKIISY